MKKLAVFAMAAALLGGLSVAQAQNAPNSKVPISPNSINKGNLSTTPSGAESRSAATGEPAQISGTGKYCSKTSAGGPLDCIYASLSACKKQNKSGELQCVANPGRSTTGSRH